MLECTLDADGLIPIQIFDIKPSFATSQECLGGFELFEGQSISSTVNALAYARQQIQGKPLQPRHLSARPGEHDRAVTAISSHARAKGLHRRHDAPRRKDNTEVVLGQGDFQQTRLLHGYTVSQSRREMG